MSIDWDKPVQTRDGRDVLIYTREGSHHRLPVVGEIGTDEHAPPLLTRWDLEGRADCTNGPEDSDLVNVPQQHTVTVNAYRESGGELYYAISNSRAEADENALSGRIACFEHTFTDGEGLE